ncbi:hypothetical protein DDI74_04030 [Chryseobacterium gleum]|uniref:hypothetical protein n=1 Tax=Chryseobacterium gleum TaxID=250 RepID=UPI001039E757|nr:hypothetical protein [Chryseobacterium gleum]QBJ85477.1 hypothetical protein DDI74_04030 [Chryseobacterium gleum]
MADLNKILDYSLSGYSLIISATAQTKINNHIIVDKDDWGKSFSLGFIDEFKTFYSRKQGHKCAYCRTKITPDGYTEPVEHITPRLLKPNWMFVIHNLVVSCSGCNSNKKTDNVLRNNENTYGHNAADCPNNSIEYRIFNPHYDKWSDHFEIEDSYFLKPKPDTKGPYTYTKCGMNRYNIVLDYLFSEKVRGPISAKILTARIRKEKDPKKVENLKKALNCVIDTI